MYVIYKQSVCISQRTQLSSVRKTSTLVCDYFHLADSCQPDAPVSFYNTFERLLSLRLFPYLQSSTVKPLRNAAHETTLTQRRVNIFCGNCCCLLQELRGTHNYTNLMFL